MENVTGRVSQVGQARSCNLRERGSIPRPYSNPTGEGESHSLRAYPTVGEIFWGKFYGEEDLGEVMETFTISQPRLRTHRGTEYTSVSRGVSR
jgi:hypothetical protein